METKDSFHKVSRHLRIVSGLTVVSRILGLLRDQAMSSAFGAGPILDSFTVAFRLPNLARVLLGEGALTTAFLPVVGRELREQGKESASRLTWAVFLVLASVLTLLVVVLEGILWSVGAMLNLSDEATLLRNLIAILLPYVILICLAAQVCAVLNAVERFAWSAIVPIVLNVVWLAGLWFLIPRWEDPSSQVYAMTWIIVVAGMIQLLCPLPVLWQLGFGFRYDWRKSLSRVMSIARDMLPVVFGLSVTQLNSVFDSLVAWGMTCPPTGEQSISFLPNHPRFPLAEGTATALYLGQRLYQFPLGVFGVALGTVLFPLLTAHAQQGDDHKLRADMSLGVRLVVAIGIPASAGLMLIAHPLAVLFFQHGKFTIEDALRTGDMIACYSSGVWAYCGLLILQRGFYAIGDRTTPVSIGIGALALNVVLNLSLVWPLAGRGLAISTAIVAATQCFASVWLLEKKMGRLHWSEIGITVVKTTVATAAMSASCLSLQGVNWGLDGTLGRILQLAVPLIAGLITYFVAAQIIGFPEPWMVISPSKQDFVDRR